MKATERRCVKCLVAYDEGSEAEPDGLHYDNRGEALGWCPPCASSALGSLIDDAQALVRLLEDGLAEKLECSPKFCSPGGA